jgi:2-polyprenyl-3-methyl-5-hydroxy-6-metoxy-1,4-benzoquinol methylase
VEQTFHFHSMMLIGVTGFTKIQIIKSFCVMIKKFIRYSKLHGTKKTLIRSFREISRRLYGFTGERVIPTYKNDCFYAHFSIYNFAKEFIQNKVVFDAGCGTGYGTFYLVTHGANIAYGIDIAEDAIRFAKKTYRNPNLKFTQMSCENMNLKKQSFDVVFSSNVIEHLENYHAFLRSIKDVLKEDGTFILATPPLYTAELNDANPFHCTNMTVAEWIDILSIYFNNIETYRHFFKTDKTNKNGTPYILDFSNSPKNCIIDESDFYFEKVPVSSFREGIETLTAIFVLSSKKEIGVLADDKV